MLFLWDTQQVEVFSGSDNPTSLLCQFAVLCGLVTICWYYILTQQPPNTPAHNHHMLPRKHGQPSEFSSKRIPWRHKACPNETLGVLHTASTHVAENEDLRDSTRCKLVWEVWRINVPLPCFWHRTISHQVQGGNCLFCWVQSLHVPVLLMKILVMLPEAIMKCVILQSWALASKSFASSSSPCKSCCKTSKKNCVRHWSPFRQGMWSWWLINQDVKLQFDSSTSHSMRHRQYCKLVFYFWIPDVGNERETVWALGAAFWARTNTWKGIQRNHKTLGLKSGQLYRKVF